MRRGTKNLLLCGAIAIAMLVGANADARRRASQGDETIADATADGPKGTGFLHVSITNLEQEMDPVPAVFGEIRATLRLRVRGDLAVFQTKIPRSPLGIGFGADSVNGFTIRDLILDAFSSGDGRAGGIVADLFFPGDGFAATLKVLDEDLECGRATDTIPVVGCPLGPDPGSAMEILNVADVTIAFTAP